MMRIISILPIVFICTFLHSCKKQETVAQQNTEPAKYAIQIGEKTLQLELARTPKSRETGLMYRESLPRGEGMIFVFENPQPQRFWMKNTRIPLDIGYFSADGRLKEVHRGQPYDLSGMPSRAKDLQFVVELYEGEFKRMGITLGSRLSLDTVKRAIAESGGRPADYNLRD
jgi:uncharacterized membrane protein (UPF0127 family)